mmetsp:Transcript_80847/g.210624  ORF Transcript_80847/g.210624 Transcript_80847/m.210624 type:complete len:622 (+) Transcript_80847:57-1922(+)
MAMVGPPSSSFRLNYSRRRFTDDDLTRLRHELPLKQDNLSYEEVDFSQNEFSSQGLRVVMEVCLRCPKLKVLKLYRNYIDDSGAEGLAELFSSCPNIEEVHLSHNRFTAAGVETLVAAAELARPENMSPLWLRLEQNDVADPDAVYADMQTRLSVCNRPDERYCSVRGCCKKMQVHLPFFSWQRGTRQQPENNKPTAGPAAHVPNNAKVVGPSFRVPRAEANGVPAGLRLPPPPPKANGSGTTTHGTPAWDAMGIGRHKNSGYNSGTDMHAANKNGTAAATGYPVANGHHGASPLKSHERNGYDVVASPAASPNGCADDEQGASLPNGASVGGRPSVVLDSHGRRRILPKQLEAQDASNQFVCPLCSFVVVHPVITTCSHSFCDHCFRHYVGHQVNDMKKGLPCDGPVPLIPCPQRGCQMKLRKKDIRSEGEVAKSGAAGAAGLLARLRNNLTVRCVHHSEHFKQAFGKDAEIIAREKGMTCTWIGDLGAYEDHLRKGCRVEGIIAGSEAAATNGTPKSGPPTADSPTPARVRTDPGSINISSDRADLRRARYDFNPRDTDKAQIVLKANDLVKVFDVTEAGWAAGVRICRDTLQEIGEPGWFPSGYLLPLEAPKAAPKAD